MVHSPTTASLTALYYTCCGMCMWGRGGGGEGGGCGDVHPPPIMFYCGSKNLPERV